MGGELRIELSWSVSRSKEFERCRREYWYARYASWGWWKNDPRGEKRAIAVLKSLDSLPTLAGDAVHQAIARYFELRRGGTTMTGPELFEHARECFRAGWRQSLGEEWQRRPGKAVRLDEHHYGTELAKETTDRYRDLMQACVENFLKLPVALSLPAEWLAFEQLDSYLFLGAKVYAVPDFALRRDGVLHIYDWKTGKPREDDLFQLHTYALYACERWGADPEHIVLHAAYLADGQVRTAPVDVYQLSVCQDRMSESVRAMLDLHYDPEVDDYVAGNWPVNGAPKECPRCRFRGICETARAAGLGAPAATTAR